MFFFHSIKPINQYIVGEDVFVWTFNDVPTKRTGQRPLFLSRPRYFSSWYELLINFMIKLFVHRDDSLENHLRIEITILRLYRVMKNISIV